MKKGDDFSAKTKQTLALRANYRCSNPDCLMITSGPHTEPNKFIIVGVAAHICAASFGGKRYDHTMTAEQRSSIENGIWLCAKCAKLIDSDDRKYTPELLQAWKDDHEKSVSSELTGSTTIQKSFVEAVPLQDTQDLLDSLQVSNNLGVRSKNGKVTASDLVKAGFRADRLHLILKDQEDAIKKRNYRLPQLLVAYVDEKLINVPRVWRSMIAGLPIIAQDIDSPSLNNLATLAGELHPYLSKKLRNAYHDRLSNVMIGILAELQAFLDDSARAGGIPISASTYPPPTWKNWLPWVSGWERSWRADESLLRGCWTYMVPREVVDLKIDLGKTWAGFLFDIISRLPDPDRQKGQFIKRLDPMTLIYMWCATAPQDFKPAIPNIIRYPIKNTDHTLAGIYKRWKENHGES